MATSSRLLGCRHAANHRTILLHLPRALLRVVDVSSPCCVPSSIAATRRSIPFAAIRHDRAPTLQVSEKAPASRGATPRAKARPQCRTSVRARSAAIVLSCGHGLAGHRGTVARVSGTYHGAVRGEKTPGQTLLHRASTSALTPECAQLFSRAGEADVGLPRVRAVRCADRR